MKKSFIISKENNTEENMIMRNLKWQVDSLRAPGSKN